MKKFISVLVCFLMMFSFSFAEDMKKINDIWYISEDAVEKMWKTDVKVYSVSNIVNFYTDNTNYYFKVRYYNGLNPKLYLKTADFGAA